MTVVLLMQFSINIYLVACVKIETFLRKHLIQTQDWSIFGGIGLQAGLVIHEYYGIDDRLDNVS